MKELRIAIVGPGRLGTALAEKLHAAGYRVVEIVSRDRARSRRAASALAKKLGAKATVSGRALSNTNLVWFCVPDGAISDAAKELEKRGNWRDRTAFHSSGALASDQLARLRKKGASVASVHPFMTFVASSVPDLRGVPFGVEGDAKAAAIAAGIAKQLGGEPFLIKKKQKGAYHAWGAFASPLLVALMVCAEKVARSAGIKPAHARKMMLPIVGRTLANYAQLGPAEAFSGPLVRGDVETVNQHGRVLRKLTGPRDVYRALASIAVESLPVRNRKKLTKTVKAL
jgi:predicted short-subunit dehydrogenase-like oxidoreductase (DUF2520 family)